MGDIGRFKTYWHEVSPPRGNAAERSPESVSMVLRNARILQGYSLYEVSNAINIRTSHLQAIEDGLFADLPPLVYAKGFVSAYAGFLDLNKSEIVSRFCAEVNFRYPRQHHCNDDMASSPRRPASINQPAPMNLNPLEDIREKRMPSKQLLIGAVILVFIAYGMWQLATPDNRSVALDVPPLPERFQNAEIDKSNRTLAAAPSVIVNETATPPLAPLPAATPEHYPAATNQQTQATQPDQPDSQIAVNQAPIAIQATQDSWVQLRDSKGNRLASIVLHPGETYTIPQDSIGLILSTSRLDNIRMNVHGQPVTLAVTNGTNRSQYHIMLDPARLLNGTAVFY